MGEAMAELNGRWGRGCQCLALGTAVDPRWARRSASAIAFLLVVAGRRRAALGAAGNGTDGLRIKTKTRASPAFGPLV